MESDKLLQTLDGIDVELTTRGILYICDPSEKSIEVKHSIQFESSFDALNAYANTRNPESQLITGETYDELIKNMHTLHGMMGKESWLHMLRESI
jgi:hypothetical protein